ncbi:NACHT and WD repeat domain-containing protein [Kutzneria sp. CA-103260]|uniref:NACHT and WD repeat domain-containing protein n=1 Tax=Kutzneria sp. CA-103260 TaxID=2802641 RepID=UPI001BA7C85F|nr:PQQ-binding-like beta-propeller repeat protein [Kutzneria sp. CA-103260]QUQ68273.1 WD-40 repeat-containing protein [Kutzneria sp. CA-103260]
MSTDRKPDNQPALDPTADASRSSVDARHATGVQVGEGNTQIIYSYGAGTWTEGAVPRQLVDVHGAVESPYRGLAAFDERDAPFFFGRESAAHDVLERISERLQGPGLLVVSGVSGAGKSSLIRAGVLPLIRGAGLASAAESASWPCLVFTPGRAPLDKLAVHVASVAGIDAATVRQGLDEDPTRFALTAAQAALARPGRSSTDPDLPISGQRRLMLVVDQFEQLFTQCPDEDQRRAFITALHAAATTGHGSGQTPAALVVLVMRQDFEGPCGDYPQLQTAIQQRYFVAPMTPRQLRMAISEPAKKAGACVENDLIDLLLSEIQTRPSTSPSTEANPGYAVSPAGVLPLLSHTLDKAWRHRTGEHVTISDYEWTGGIEGAVADSAQRAYDRLTPDQQSAARQLFTRLTTISSEGVDTADRASRSELIEGKSDVEARDMVAVLESFAAERLLTLGDDTVEISHEVLLTAWPLLRDWLVDTHGDRIVHTRLRATATEWKRDGRDRSYLYTGNLLEAANEAAARIAADPARHALFSQTEQEFLHASQRIHRRRVRTRQAAIAALIVFVIVLATTTFLVQQARQSADDQRDIAVSGQLGSESENPNRDPMVAKIDSLAAWGINPSPESRYAMLTAIARPESMPPTNTDGSVDVNSVAFSPDGKTLATATKAGGQLWDVATDKQVATLNANTAFVDSVAFSPDGKTLATGTVTGSNTGGTQLWDVASGKQVATLNANTGFVNSVAFSPDGKTLATSTNGHSDAKIPTGVTHLWEVATGRRIASLNTNADAIGSVSFSPDGKTLAIGTQAVGTQLWDVATDNQVSTLNANTGFVKSVAFSPDSKTLATSTNAGSGTGATQLWDVASGKQVATLNANTGFVNSVAFSPDGETLATGTNTGTQLWNVVTDNQISILNANTGFVNSVAFSPDGKTLATGTRTGTGAGGTQLWALAPRKQMATLHTKAGFVVNSVAFPPDNKTLAASANAHSGTDNSVGATQLWDVATGKQITLLDANIGFARSAPSDANSVAFSPNGKALAVGVATGTQLWDMTTRKQIAAIDNTVATSTVKYSPNGKILASGAATGTQLWDVASGKKAATLNTDTGLPLSVAFSPDSKTLAIVDTTGTRLWNVATGKQIAALNSGAGYASSVAFSPDGKTLAIGTTIGGTQLWDVATREQIAILKANTGSVASVAFSPDSKTLVAVTDTGAEIGTGNGTQLWDVATRKQIAILNSDAGYASSVAFSPDGKALAIGTDAGVQLWDVHYLNDYLPQLCAQVGGSLPPEVWSHYVPSGPTYRKVCF